MRHGYKSRELPASHPASYEMGHINTLAGSKGGWLSGIPQHKIRMSLALPSSSKVIPYIEGYRVCVIA